MYNSTAKINLLSHPFSALSFALGKKEKLHRAIILKSAKYLFGKIDAAQWNAALAEIENNDLIAANKNETVAVGNNLNTTFGKWIYCIVRIVKPEVMIETGVAHGYSSWIILNAMKKNGHGRLYSVDLPNKDTNSAYNFSNAPQTGWLVPDSLRSKWNIRLGDAKKLLPELLKEIGSPDIFFHDSDHSYEHMMYEFNLILPALKKGGIILSDDVHKNTSFEEFTATNNLRALRFNKGGCAMKG